MRARPTFIALTCALAVGSAACGSSSPPPSAPVLDENRAVGVPDLSGETAEAAASTLDEEGFVPVFTPREPVEGRDTPGECLVVDQRPQEGESEYGRDVILTLDCQGELDR
jgi:beta-lactam-binding protein with PASTA domain